MPDDFFPQICSENERIALWENHDAHTYSALNERIHRFSSGLLAATADLQEERIAFLLPASLDYVTAMHGVWRAGGIAVPLNTGSTVDELTHYLASPSVSRLIVNPPQQSAELLALCESLKIEVLTVSEVLCAEDRSLPPVDPDRRAMIVFTSGTTSKPKGVVSTHRTLRAQVETLLDAWGWSEDDSVPLFLPLHHVHGIINVLSCALWIGATVDLYPSLDLPTLTHRVTAGRYTLFMAVPTIYVKLIACINGLEDRERTAVCAGFAGMRLNVSGSAACPVTVFEQWASLTGQVLLERYGMTEIGMALSNPYAGERRAGYVGKALPGVSVRLVDEEGNSVVEEGSPGEIHVRGDSVFLEYWDNASATREAFDNGWFRTGDIAVLEDGYYRIMGRSSVDIIKSGGYKLSALEIEGVLLNHAAIAEVAVVGVPDSTWGEAVAAVAVLKPGESLNLAQLKNWCSERMSSYKIPKILKLADALPRNAMGKVTKQKVSALLNGPE